MLFLSPNAHNAWGWSGMKQKPGIKSAWVEGMHLGEPSPRPPRDHINRKVVELQEELGFKSVVGMDLSQPQGQKSIPLVITLKFRCHCDTLSLLIVDYYDITCGLFKKVSLTHTRELSLRKLMCIASNHRSKLRQAGT